MDSFKKKNKKRNILIVLIILILIVLIIMVTDKKKTTFIEKGIKDCYSYVIKGINIPINYVKESIEKFNLKSDIYDENKKLKEEISKIDNLNAENEQLKGEISNLKELLNLNSLLSEYNYLNAIVINRNLGYWYDTLTIDKGEIHGIKQNSAVVSQYGLIGYIDSVNYLTSNVKLITSDLNNKISVKIKQDDKYIYGLLTKYENGYFILEGIGEEVLVGSVVITAGLGTNFPEGIYIGDVYEIIADNFGLSKTVKVKTKINYDLISTVGVLEVK